MSVPGFVCIRNKIVPKEENRGGVCVMIQTRLWSQVYNISIEPAQVWFSLENVPNITIGAVYITPRDSPYFKPDSLALIQEKMHAYDHKGVFIIGDLNARMHNIQSFDNAEKGISYEVNPDQNTNENEKDWLTFCKENNLVPVNHMKYKDIQCEGGF